MCISFYALKFARMPQRHPRGAARRDPQPSLKNL